MAKQTKQPEMLRELFEAPERSLCRRECLARPALSERLLTNWYTYETNPRRAQAARPS